MEIFFNVLICVKDVYILNSHPHSLPTPPDVVAYGLSYALFRLRIDLVALKDQRENDQLASDNVLHVQIRHLILSASRRPV